MCANSEGSGETARMRRIAWAFADRLCDTYHNLMSWLISRSSGTEKTILKRTMKGARMRKRPKEMWRQHQSMDRNGVWRFTEGVRGQGKVASYWCNVICHCGAPTTIIAKGLREEMSCEIAKLYGSIWTRGLSFKRNPVTLNQSICNYTNKKN